ncbi:MAG TPA: hypothetical protein VEL31_26530, partial [Ktedonobacteraceae bacterium]|nr:hypothetical protein [Ktedonobacteraceae bacterium]
MSSFYSGRQRFFIGNNRYAGGAGGRSPSCQGLGDPVRGTGNPQLTSPLLARRRRRHVLFPSSVMKRKTKRKERTVMLDLAFIRSNPDALKEAARVKNNP